ncbi:MAG: FtsX-like permease family protein, partial [Clostridia bacterium]|nr:FtsX-like permease family protein [Clostridia bacterium]
MVTHNGELAEQYATRTVRLKDGRIISDTDPFDPSSERSGEIKKTEAPEGVENKRKTKKKKVSMSFLTALSLSLNNLRTKKGRTFLTAFAGSIGIIGIAMILSLSTGIHNYVSDTQRETLSSYPIVLEREPNDMLKKLLTARQGDKEKRESRSETRVYSSPRLYRMFNAAFTGSNEKNNISAFKSCFDAKLSDKESELSKLVTAVQYGYEPELNVYFETEVGKYKNTDISQSLFSGEGDDSAATSMFSMVSSRMSTMNLFSELLSGRDGEPLAPMVKEQYTLLAGNWPEEAGDIVLLLDERGEVSDNAFYALGYIEDEELQSILSSVFKGEELEEPERSAEFSEIIGRQLKLILNFEKYRRTDDAQAPWEYVGDDEKAMELIIKNGVDLKIVGILKPGSSSAMEASGAFGYTRLLTDLLIERASGSELIAEQQKGENENLDLITGLPFVLSDEDEPTRSEKAQLALEYFASLNDAKKVELYTSILALPDEAELDSMVDGYLSIYPDREAQIELAASSFGFSKDEMREYLADYSDEELKALMVEQIKNIVSSKYEENAELQIAQLVRDLSEPGDLFGVSGYKAVAALFDDRMAGESVDKLALYHDKFMPAKVSGSTLSERLKEFGLIDKSEPATISIYTSSFDDKEAVTDAIKAYNESVSDPDDAIEYTDYVALLMSGVTTMIDAVSYGLIAFVAISLVVSSIMIGIITYISVLERTKEIGILRSIGASKRNVKSVFNAETLIVGFFAGLLGIGVTVLLCIPLNMIIQKLTGIETLRAVLPLKAAAVLVGISMLLTLISGLIPAGVAARKDPVTALRTE